jgi:hypothetical protein
VTGNSCLRVQKPKPPRTGGVFCEAAGNRFRPEHGDR